MPNSMTEMTKPKLNFAKSWRLRVLALLVVGAAAGVAALYIFKKPVDTPLMVRSIGARLDLVAGDVTVTENGASTKALSGSPLAVGSRIATAKGARALIRAADGAAVFLRGESEVVLEKKGILLTRGEVWFDAPRVDGGAIEPLPSASTGSKVQV